MTKIEIVNVDHARKARAFAASLGGEPKSSLLHCMRTINRIKRNAVRYRGKKGVVVRVTPDWVAHSFAWFISSDEGPYYHGGVILHGFEETYSEELAPKSFPHWSVVYELLDLAEMHLGNLILEFGIEARKRLLARASRRYETNRIGNLILEFGIEARKRLLARASRRYETNRKGEKMRDKTIYTRENPPSESVALQRIFANKCPFCRDTVQCDGPAEIENGFAYQEVYCERGDDSVGPECGHWLEVYKLVRWEE